MWTAKMIILIIILLSNLSIILSSLYGQTKLFRPSSKTFYTPDIPYKDFMINGIHGQLFNNYKNEKIIIFCHGNNLNISARKYIIDLCNNNSINLVLFDYQGYGKSSGSPYQYSLHPDAQNVYNYVIDQGFKPQDIIVWGESLGGSPAIYLAENNQIDMLVLVSTFSSMNHIFDDYNWKYLPKFIEQIFDPFDSLKRVKNIKCPVVIIHSKDDTLIPYKNAERIYDSIPHLYKRLIPISGPHENPSIEVDLLDTLIKDFKKKTMFNKTYEMISN